MEWLVMICHGLITQSTGSLRSVILTKILNYLFLLIKQPIILSYFETNINICIYIGM